MSERILIVDDEPIIVNALERSLRGKPYNISSANSAEAALEILDREEMDVVISDERMPGGMSGAEFISIVAQSYPEIPVILLTGYPTVEVALEAVNEGHIYSFLTKPWNDIELEKSIDQAIRHRKVLITGAEQLSSQSILGIDSDDDESDAGLRNSLTDTLTLRRPFPKKPPENNS